MNGEIVFIFGTSDKQPSVVGDQCSVAQSLWTDRRCRIARSGSKPELNCASASFFVIAKSILLLPMRHIRQHKSGNLTHRHYQRGIILCCCVLLVGACSREEAGEYAGNAQRGLLAIERAQCGSCHLIPGVPNADGLVGPPLDHFANRTMVAGLLPNTPDHLVRWLRFPQSVVPGNGMPDTGLSEDQARDVAAY